MRSKPINWAARSFVAGLALALGVALPLVALAQDKEAPGQATVFAAASLHDVLSDLAAQFEQQTGRQITLVFGASSTMARQIEAGAPADSFVSAHLGYAQDVAELADADLRDLFGNRLVLIAGPGRDEDMAIEALPEALGSGRLAMGDPTHVPAGIYARQALERLGLWDELANRLAPAADVRGALQFVQVGAAPFGLVYRTDARDANVAIVARIDTALHDPIRYWGVQIDPENVTAEMFFTYIASFEGQVLVDWYGFDSVTSLD